MTSFEVEKNEDWEKVLKCLIFVSDFCAKWDEDFQEKIKIWDKAVALNPGGVML